MFTFYFKVIHLNIKTYFLYLYITVVQRPQDKAPKNAENESRKLHTEYTQGNVFNLILHHNFTDCSKLNNCVHLNFSGFRAVFAFVSKLNTFC
jgi:hypothetical protein